MRDRTGEVWELTYGGKPAEIVLVVRSARLDSCLKPTHFCLVLASTNLPLARVWPEGDIKRIGEWDDLNGWRRIA